MEKLWYDFEREVWYPGEVIDWQNEPAKDHTNFYLLELCGMRCIVNAPNEAYAKYMANGRGNVDGYDWEQATCVLLDPGKIYIGVIARESRDS